MLLNIEKLSEALASDWPTVLAFVRDGRLPGPIVIGDRLVRWPQRTIDAWVADGCPATEPPAPDQFRHWRLLHHVEEASRDRNVADAD